MITAEPVRRVATREQDVRTLDECKAAIQLWNLERWTATKAIRYFDDGWAFCISREIFQYINIGPEDSLRGYIGVFDDELRLVLINVSLDLKIYNGTVTDVDIYTAPYIKMGMRINDLINGKGSLYAKIRRWIKSHNKYIETVIKRNEPKKSNLNGLVRLFEIKTADIVNEFKSDSHVVLSFPGLKRGYDEKAIDLIFMGADLQLNPLTSLPFAAPDDFTTPRPPFGTDLGYGLL
jgi:hypothetical protein